MAIFYLDPASGSDAAAGTSWGTAWKTFTSGATAARLTPGDEIRVAKSPDPVNIGTATWTNNKVGNSITFDTAPTKQIDTMKAGWVTMGAGSTVTNAQATAYMNTISFGGTVFGALQVTTSAALNMAYKPLGSTEDFSAHQQISFWFRPAAAFDCSGAQNMFIRLCSDTVGATPVNTLTMPKWSYAANIWYPIVIDSGGALGSNIQSVSITTTSNTTATFYFDEMFASPAAGLTLRSLIGLNDNDWHAIRTIRDADVQLLAGFTPGTAAGSSTTGVNVVDASWCGTTQTSATYKVEGFTSQLPTTGPAATYGVNQTEVGTTAALYKYTGGWDTTTDLQDGTTFFDNITQTTGSVGVNALSGAYAWFDNFGFIRYTLTHSSNTNYIMSNMTFVACTSLNHTQTHAATFGQLLLSAGFTSVNFKSISGCSSVPTHSMISLPKFPVIYGNIWGCSGTGQLLTLSSHNDTDVTINNVYPAPCSLNSGGVVSTGSSFMTVKINDIRQCQTNNTLGNCGWISNTGYGNKYAINSINLQMPTNSSFTVPVTMYIGSFSGTVSNLINSWVENTVLYINSYSVAGTLIAANSGATMNQKLYLHKFNGAADYFKVIVGDAGSGSIAPYFELQGTDVYTPGSKAIKFTGPSWLSSSYVYNHLLDLKLASAAAVANKLVTITARVKRNSASNDAGIYVDGITRMVPGYTDNISSSCTTTGSFDLVTVTFTPTADCVFDVYAWMIPRLQNSPDIVWDALTISQAA